MKRAREGAGILLQVHAAAASSTGWLSCECQGLCLELPWKQRVQPLGRWKWCWHCSTVCVVSGAMAACRAVLVTAQVLLQELSQRALWVVCAPTSSQRVLGGLVAETPGG